jgi:hypothetical protein
MVILGEGANEDRVTLIASDPSILQISQYAAKA